MTQNKTNSYWNETGLHQGAYDRLHKALVPASGPAATIAGEMLRAISCVYYDTYNNGGGNLDFALKEHVETVITFKAQSDDARSAKSTLREFVSEDPAPGWRDGYGYSDDDEDIDHQASISDLPGFCAQLEILTDEIVRHVAELEKF